MYELTSTAVKGMAAKVLAAEKIPDPDGERAHAVMLEFEYRGYDDEVSMRPLVQKLADRYGWS